MKRKEPCFWIQDDCSVCGHSCPMIYAPNLLIKPAERECYSKYNPLRKNNKCFNKWSFAATEDKKKEIIKLLNLAKRQDEISEEYKRNRKTLGYIY